MCLFLHNNSNTLNDFSFKKISSSYTCMKLFMELQNKFFFVVNCIAWPHVSYNRVPLYETLWWYIPVHECMYQQTKKLRNKLILCY